MENIRKINVFVEYWVVGASYNGVEDQKIRFLANNCWQDGWSELDNEKRNVEKLSQVKVGDYLIMKSSSNKGKGRKIVFTRIKAIGRVTDKVNYYTFSVKWNTDGFPKDFDNISYRQTIERLREDELRPFVKNFINTHNL